MIDFLRGKPVFVETDHVVLDVRDIGYRVFCPNPYALAGKSGEEVQLFIHYHVREDAIQLFGFPSREEQALFRKLIDVTGIGPRVAIGIMSGATAEHIVQAVQNEDLPFLMRLPGIGKKTAQRIVIDLKDKLEGIGISLTGNAGAGLTGTPLVAEYTGSLAAAWREAKDALAALGFSDSETEQVWKEIRDKAQEGDKADQLIKLALQSFHKVK